MATFGLEPPKSRCTALGSGTKQRFKVAVAGYLVTITFGAVFIAARILAPGQAPSVALGAAIVMALPLAVAFVGDKIKSFKGFGIEVETKAATERVTEIAPVAQTSDDGYAPARATGSGVDVTSENQTHSADGIPAQVVRLIKSPQSEIVELDLRDGAYWWPSRLYLLAALLNDYTNVKRIVFVQATEAGTLYAGMAKPLAVARRIEASISGIGAAYQEAREQAINDLSGTPEPFSMPAAPAVRMTESTAKYWARMAAHSRLNKTDAEQRVNRDWLERVLGQDWRWAAFETDSQPDNPLLQYQVVTSIEEYTALLTDGRLTRVIGRDRLAVSIATAYLKRLLHS